MFFQEFFGVFMNDYSDIYNDVTQSAKIYVGQNALLDPYVGNQVLPIGENPFIPHPPTPSEDNGLSPVWIVVLSLLCALLIGFLGFALYKWKIAQWKQEHPMERNSEVQRLVNSSGAISKDEEQIDVEPTR